jgi:pimeloyl-ACP methyl ester carboxylesterase
MARATIHGLDVHYNVRGSGPSLLFVHGGFGGMASTLSPNDQDWADGLTDRYTFIHYDRRSTGRSAYPDTGYDLETLARDAHGLLAHLELREAFVMGDSAGGPIAITFALLHPEMTRGLVLAETGARLLGGSFGARIRERVEVLCRDGADAAYAARKAAGSVGLGERTQWYTLPDHVQTRVAREQEAATERLRQTAREDRVRWYAGELWNYAAYLDVDLHPRLADIGCPTLVLHGDRDPLVPHALGAALAAGIPAAELVTVPDAEHGVMYFPGARTALRRWLDEQTLTPPGNRNDRSASE